MQRWVVDLVYVAGPLGSEGRVVAPRGTQLRELGLMVLGEHSGVAAGVGERGVLTHDAGFKPRAVRSFVAPGPGLAGSMVLVWLSDLFAPPRDPLGVVGQVLTWGPKEASRGRREVRVVGVRLLEERFLDDLVAGGAELGGRVLRLRTVSPVVFGSVPGGSPAMHLDSTVVVSGLASRWQAVQGWSPKGELPRRDPVLREVAEHLLTCTAFARVRHLRVAPRWQVATTAGVPQYREPLHFDVDLVCFSPSPEAVAALGAFAALAGWAGLGSYTTVGLGVVTADPGTSRPDL